MRGVHANISPHIILKNIDLRPAAKVDHIAAGIMEVIVFKGNSPDTDIDDVDCLTGTDSNGYARPVELIVKKSYIAS